MISNVILKYYTKKTKIAKQKLSYFYCGCYSYVQKHR